jgi:hypothetical protein
MSCDAGVIPDVIVSTVVGKEVSQRYRLVFIRIDICIFERKQFAVFMLLPVALGASLVFVLFYQ